MEREPVEQFPPGDYVREEIEARGWTQEVLAEILGTSARLVNEVITAKRAVTPETARALGEAFGTGPTVWMNLETTYRLSLLRGGDSKVAERARLYGRYPVRDMVRRQWIETSSDFTTLERRVCDWFETSTIEDEPKTRAAARNWVQDDRYVPGHTAWAMQAKHMARQMCAGDYSPKRLDEALVKLKPLLADVDSIAKAAGILADSGIRLVVIEPIPNTRIDGGCLWLDEKSPVIALSMRYDRISAFWLPLLHELDHLRHRDGEIVEELSTASAAEDKSDAEARASAFAADFMIPAEAMAEFITRKGPLFSTNDITGFAAEHKVHSGLVVAQLHQRGAWPASKGRKLMAKVRGTVTRSVKTDGWGRTASAGGMSTPTAS